MSRARTVELDVWLDEGREQLRGCELNDIEAAANLMGLDPFKLLALLADAASPATAASEAQR